MKPKLLTAAILSFGVIAGTATLASAMDTKGSNPGRDTPSRGFFDGTDTSSSGREDNRGYLSSGPNWRRHSIELNRDRIRSHRPVRAPSWWRALWD